MPGEERAGTYIMLVLFALPDPKQPSPSAPPWLRAFLKPSQAFVLSFWGQSCLWAGHGFVWSCYSSIHCTAEICMGHHGGLHLWVPLSLTASCQQALFTASRPAQESGLRSELCPAKILCRVVAVIWGTGYLEILLLVLWRGSRCSSVQLTGTL